MSKRPRCCKTCRAALVDPPPGVVRCARCQPSFEAWLRGESPDSYTPRTDGVWADLAKPSEK